jgi:hypothetical protein
MLGAVGVPLPGVDLRLEAVPELGYLPSDPRTPRGEVGTCTIKPNRGWTLVSMLAPSLDEAEVLNE